MAGGKIRLQRDHSESQRHLLMFRLTVHTQTTGSSYHIFLKVNVSVLTERWRGKRHFYTFLERTNWLKFSRSWNMCPFLPIASQGNHLNASALYKKMLFAAVSVHFKKPKPNQQNLRLPRLLQPGRVAEDDLWPPLHSPGIQTWGTTPRP